MKAELVTNSYFAIGNANGKRSRLEVYFDILHVLAYRKPLRLTHITQKANVNGAKTILQTGKGKDAAGVIYE